MHKGSELFPKPIRRATLGGDERECGALSALSPLAATRGSWFQLRSGVSLVDRVYNHTGLPRLGVQCYHVLRIAIRFLKCGNASSFRNEPYARAKLRVSVKYS